MNRHQQPGFDHDDQPGDDEPARDRDVRPHHGPPDNHRQARGNPGRLARCPPAENPTTATFAGSTPTWPAVSRNWRSRPVHAAWNNRTLRGRRHRRRSGSAVAAEHRADRGAQIGAGVAGSF
jgi:hypothetical protein